MENTFLSKLTGFVRENWRKIFKFGCTGGLGTVTNLVLFFVFADKLAFPDIPVNVGCFLVAGTQNYLINHAWTFRTQATEKASFRQWAAFMLSSLAGYCINLGVYILLTRLSDWQYKVIPQALGILAGMVVNFLISNYVVFKKQDASQPSADGC